MNVNQGEAAPTGTILHDDAVSQTDAPANHATSQDDHAKRDTWQPLRPPELC